MNFDWVRTFWLGFFGVIALMIIYVRAGQFGGATGGQQTSQIISAGAGGLGTLGKDLNGG